LTVIHVWIPDGPADAMNTAWVLAGTGCEQNIGMSPFNGIALLIPERDSSGNGPRHA